MQPLRDGFSLHVGGLKPTLRKTAGPLAFGRHRPVQPQGRFQAFLSGHEPPLFGLEKGRAGRGFMIRHETNPARVRF